jgi:peptide deformylase
MVDETLLPSVIQSLQKHVEVKDTLSYEVLKEQLTATVVYMLLHEMEKLMGILYRIDVNERKVKNAFAQNNPKLIAPILADLIIERELQKAQHRANYKP